MAKKSNDINELLDTNAHNKIEDQKEIENILGDIDYKNNDFITPVGTDVGESIYDINIPREQTKNLEELRGQRQGRLAKLGSGLVNTITGTATGLVADAAYLLDLENYYNFEKSAQEGFGNWLSDLVETTKEKLKLPVYRTNESLGFSPTSAGWWADAMPVMGEIAALAIPAEGAVFAASKIGKFAKGDKALKAIINFQKGISDGEKLSQLSLFEKSLKGITGATFSRQMESLLEGKQTYEETLRRIKQEKPDISDDEAKMIAGNAAKENYERNWIMLLQDIPQYMLLHKSFKKADDLFSKEGIKSIIKNSLSESGEEAYQFISDKEAQRSALIEGNIIKDDITSFDERMINYAKDGDFWTSAFLGGLGGGLFGAYATRQNKNNQENYNQLLNAHKSILTGDKDSYYRSIDNIFNEHIVERASDNKLKDLKENLNFLISNPENIEDSERSEIIKRLGDKVKDIEYAENIQKSIMTDRNLSPELKKLTFTTRLNQRSSEQRLININRELTKLINEDLTLGIDPLLHNYKQNVLLYDGIKDIEGLSNRKKELEKIIKNTSKEILNSNLFNSIDELNTSLMSSTDEQLKNLLVNKEIENQILNSSKSIISNINNEENRKKLQDLINLKKDEDIKSEKIDSFTEKISKGEKLSSNEDIQFYENNKNEIENKLKELSKKDIKNNSISNKEQNQIFTIGNKIQLRGSGKNEEIESIDDETGAIYLKNNPVPHFKEDFYIPSSLPESEKEILNNTDITQPYTGERKDGLGIHESGTIEKIEEVLKNVGEINDKIRVRLTKKISVEGNIERGNKHYLNNNPKEPKVTLAPNTDLDVIYELKDNNGDWFDAFHGRHSSQYVIVDPSGNTKTIEFNNFNKDQIKSLFEIRDKDITRELKDEEIEDLINNQNKLNNINNIYKSIYNKEGDTIIEGNELKNKYNIKIFSKKGIFDIIPNFEDRPLLTTINKALINDNYYIFDTLNITDSNNLWTNIMGNINPKKAKELLDNVSNKENFLTSLNQRYIALGKDENDYFLFPLDTTNLSESTFKAIIDNILKNKNKELLTNEKNKINDDLEKNIYFFGPRNSNISLKLDTIDNKPSKFQLNYKINNRTIYYDIPFDKMESIDSMIKELNKKGYVINKNDIKVGLPKTTETRNINSKDLAKSFNSVLKDNIFKNNKIYIDFSELKPIERNNEPKQEELINPFKVDKTGVVAGEFTINTIDETIENLENQFNNEPNLKKQKEIFNKIKKLKSEKIAGKTLINEIDDIKGVNPSGEGKTKLTNKDVDNAIKKCE